MAHERILWVEDEADTELQYLYAPVVVAGFDLHVARDASQALAELKKANREKKEFDAVIVDIRIPPGYDRRWIDLYNQAGADPAAARLGLHLVRALLEGKDKDEGVEASNGEETSSGEAVKIRLQDSEKPQWLSPQKCALFSVQGDDIPEDLKGKGLVYKAKGPELDVYALLTLIKLVLQNSD